MWSKKKLVAAAAPMVLVALGGCAQSFDARVNRFSMLAPPTQGETFTIQPENPQLQGSIEFRSYAQLVAQQLERFGYRQASDARSANLVISLDYFVENGRERVTTTPGFSGFGPGWGWGWGGWGRWGRWGRFGAYDPFWGGGFDGFGADVRSYTVYDSQLRMEISRTGNGERVWEGTARATSRNDDLPWLVPNLIEAIFTGFPGNTGETIKVRIPQPSRRPSS
jgi:hypothetical protein